VEFDRVTCFGKISVRIPRHWAEGNNAEKDTHEFFDPSGPLGTLRVSLFSNERPLAVTLDNLQEELFEDRDEEGVRFFRVDEDTVIAEYDELATQEDDVHMFYWDIMAFINPHLTRRALFSYAVDPRRAKTSEFQEELKMVRDCIYATHFTTPNPS
jgi:hypothetical protein